MLADRQSYHFCKLTYLLSWELRIFILTDVSLRRGHLSGVVDEARVHRVQVAVLRVITLRRAGQLGLVLDESVQTTILARNSQQSMYVQGKGAKEI